MKRFGLDIHVRRPALTASTNSIQFVDNSGPGSGTNTSFSYAKSGNPIGHP